MNMNAEMTQGECGASEKGIVITTTGHPYYARMAFNLAASIKAAQPDFPIAILHNGRALSHLGPHQLDIFDYIIEIDEGIPAAQIAKLYAAFYTPFEKTLLLDADMLWLPVKTPDQLFAEVAACDFTGITEGKEGDASSKYYFWADTAEIRAKYDIKTDIYQWRSEVMYFNVEGREIIKRALAITENPNLNSIKMFAHTVPDELGINIAAAEAGVHPHVYRWQPSFWHLMNRNVIPKPADLYNQYYLISFGSNYASGTIKQFYNQLVQAACYKLARQHVFSLESKKSFLPLVRDKM